MHLEDVRRQVGREHRHVRNLEGPCGDDDLVGLDRRIIFEIEDERVIRARERANAVLKRDREVELVRVALQVLDYLVARGVAVGIAGKLQAGEAVVAAGREEGQRVPAGSPGRSDRARAVENHEVPALLG